MTRILCSVLAAGAAALASAPAAHAASRDYEPRPRAFAVRAVSASERRHEHEWGELERARRRFYRHWNGNPYQRFRFERWYAHRCEELRRY